MASLTPVSSLVHKSVRLGTRANVAGWVRSVRKQKRVAFVSVSDGSSAEPLQVVVEPHLLPDDVTTGAAVKVSGIIALSPRRDVQAFELQGDAVTLVGACEQETYPLQKKSHSMEFLRSIPHLRHRSNTISAVARVRNRLTQALHGYFQQRDFIQVFTPVLTSNDTEGAGEQFEVTPMSDTLSDADGEDSPAMSTFFGDNRAFLTVSGQLHAEALACAMSRVYTFGPTFRAENSNTSRHLSEFWMLEPEVAFVTMEDLLVLTEECVKHCVRELLEHGSDDVLFFQKRVDEGLEDRLEVALRVPYDRMTYAHALKVLKSCGEPFQLPASWQGGLHSEHERYLADEYCRSPVFITDYPAMHKPFYMRHHDPDNKDLGSATVEAFDLLVPRIGELVGGSMREERYDVLHAAMNSVEDREALQWYLDLRRFGSVPHGGFGLGFERLVQFVTGINNIRDTIPFPRMPGYCRI